LARVPVQIDVASEFRYREPVFDPDTLVIGITQSGESADTLAAMRLAREAGSPVLALTNTPGSQATRDADFVLYTRAGLEIGVAATKTHTAQVAAMLLLALRLAWARGSMAEDALKALGHELRTVPELAEQLLARPSAIKQIAERYHDERFFLYLGRGMGFAVCLEGALKLKEISYIPTEAYAAGEMKHGPIALLDVESPVVVVADDGPVFPKLVSNIEEVRARGADVIAVATDGNEVIGELSRDVLWIPKTDHHLAPILAVIPLQLLAYHIAGIKGLNVDQPRNLAKTVTVE
jgi:glucosamine--fructose-6-phosphate aminotransferase (isomerizing)